MLNSTYTLNECLMHHFAPKPTNNFLKLLRNLSEEMGFDLYVYGIHYIKECKKLKITLSNKKEFEVCGVNESSTDIITVVMDVLTRESQKDVVYKAINPMFACEMANIISQKIGEYDKYDVNILKNKINRFYGFEELLQDTQEKIIGGNCLAEYFHWMNGDEKNQYIDYLMKQIFSFKDDLSDFVDELFTESFCETLASNIKSKFDDVCYLSLHNFKILVKNNGGIKKFVQELDYEHYGINLSHYFNYMNDEIYTYISEKLIKRVYFAYDRIL